MDKGHDIAFWAAFLSALHEADPQVLVGIEHEDAELDAAGGLGVAPKVLVVADAAPASSLAANWPTGPTMRKARNSRL